MDFKIVAMAVVVLGIFAFFYFRGGKNKKAKIDLKQDVRKDRAGKGGAEGSDTGLELSASERAIYESVFAVNLGAKRPTQTGKYPHVQCYVYDNISGRCGPEILSGEEVGKIIEIHGSLGRPRDIERTGKYAFYLDRNLENGERKLSPTVFPFSHENTSIMLFMATQQPEIPTVFNFAEIKGLLQKLAPLLLFAGCVLFAMWTTIRG